MFWVLNLIARSLKPSVFCSLTSSQQCLGFLGYSGYSQGSWETQEYDEVEPCELANILPFLMIKRPSHMVSSIYVSRFEPFHLGPFPQSFPGNGILPFLGVHGSFKSWVGKDGLVTSSCLSILAFHSCYQNPCPRSGLSITPGTCQGRIYYTSWNEYILADVETVREKITHDIC